MPFDTSTRLYGLLAERIYVLIYNEKRSDTICIKPMLFLELMTGFGPVTSALPRRCATYCATSAYLIVVARISKPIHYILVSPRCQQYGENFFIRVSIVITNHFCECDGEWKP